MRRKNLLRLTSVVLAATMLLANPSVTSFVNGSVNQVQAEETTSIQSADNTGIYAFTFSEEFLDKKDPTYVADLKKVNYSLPELCELEYYDIKGRYISYRVHDGVIYQCIADKYCETTSWQQYASIVDVSTHVKSMNYWFAPVARTEPPTEPGILGKIFTVQKIAEYAFAGCYNLTSVNMLMNIQYFGVHAFDSCTSLSKVKFKDDNVDTLYDETIFTNCPLLDRSKIITDPERPTESSSNQGSIACPIGEDSYVYYGDGEIINCTEQSLKFRAIDQDRVSSIRIDGKLIYSATSSAWGRTTLKECVNNGSACTKTIHIYDELGDVTTVYVKFSGVATSTTEESTTEEVTVAPTTATPTTAAPTTEKITEAPTTVVPTTEKVTVAPTTAVLTTEKVTVAPTTATPTTEKVTVAPTTTAPTTEKVTEAPTTTAPTTEKVTEAPTTTAPTTEKVTVALTTTEQFTTQEITSTTEEISEIAEGDTTPPVIKGFKNKQLTNKAVTVSVIDDNLKSLKVNGKKTTSGTKFTKSGTYKVVAIDKAGNKTSSSFTIDKMGPKVKSTTKKLTVTDTNGVKWVKIGSKKYSYKKLKKSVNIKLKKKKAITVKACDRAGNITGVKFIFK